MLNISCFSSKLIQSSKVWQIRLKNLIWKRALHSIKDSKVIPHCLNHRYKHRSAWQVKAAQSIKWLWFLKTTKFKVKEVK